MERNWKLDWNTSLPYSLFLWNIVFVLHDYDLIENEEEYECTMDSKGCYVYNSKREEE